MEFKRGVLFGMSIGSVESFFGADLKVWSVLFIQSASLLLKSCSFFFQTTGLREKKTLEVISKELGKKLYMLLRSCKIEVVSTQSAKTQISNLLESGFSESADWIEVKRISFKRCFKAQDS